MDADEIVRLTHTANPQEAYVLKQMLEDAGIACRVVGDMLDAGIGDISGLQPEIWIHHRDVERAQRLIEEHHRSMNE